MQRAKEGRRGARPPRSLSSHCRPRVVSGGRITQEFMPRLQIIIAATRPSRKGHLIGKWFETVAREHGGFDVEVVDLAEVDLPLFDESAHPRLGTYAHEHTRKWSETVAAADAYVVVTPEYDHVPPASLLNAMQYLIREWAYKPMGFVSYGGVSAGTRAVEVLKRIASALRMMPIPDSVHIPFFTKWINENEDAFEPEASFTTSANLLLDELGRWAGALQTLREEVADPA